VSRVELNFFADCFGKFVVRAKALKARTKVLTTNLFIKQSCLFRLLEVSAISLEKILPIFAHLMRLWSFGKFRLMMTLLIFAVTLPNYTKTCADFCQYNILFPKKFAWQ
jgi:hypothetical protein